MNTVESVRTIGLQDHFKSREVDVARKENGLCIVFFLIKRMFR